MDRDVLKDSYFSDRFSSAFDKDELDEKLLWTQFKSGSESAFIKIYEEFYDVLLNYGYQLSGNKGMTQDAIQDLFIHIRQRREGLCATDSIKFYLMKCLKRRIIKELKESHKRFPFSQDQPSFEITFSHEKVIIDKQLKEEQSFKLNAALKNLSGKKKEALYYFFFEDMDYEQIRAMMGYSNIKSVRNLIYKAVGILKSTIK